MSSIFPWINDDDANTYFELSLDSVPDCMKKMSLIASKTYTRGLILISIYFEKAIYFIVQSGEGDQPLLDVRFPSVYQHGQGLHIACYSDESLFWRKLTLWHVVDSSNSSGGSPFNSGSTASSSAEGTLEARLPRIKTINVSNKNYEQTYCILKSSFDAYSPTLSVHHDVLFRFGSWCYSGRVQLTPSLNLADIPYVIPALRMQQSRLDYLCDVSSVPTTSPFAGALGYCQKIAPILGTHYTTLFDTIRHYTTLYHTIPRYTTLYDTIPRYTTLYHAIPRYTTLYHAIQHYATLYDTIRHYTTLYHTTRHFTTLYHTIPHYTTLYHAILHYTTLYHTIPRNTTTMHTLNTQ